MLSRKMLSCQLHYSFLWKFISWQINYNCAACGHYIFTHLTNSLFLAHIAWPRLKHFRVTLAFGYAKSHSDVCCLLKTADILVDCLLFFEKLHISISIWVQYITWIKFENDSCIGWSSFAALSVKVLIKLLYLICHV